MQAYELEASYHVFAGCCFVGSTWIEAGNYSFNHFPDLNYDVSFSSSFQRIQFQLFKGLVVVAADTFYLSQDGLLDFLKSLNLSFLNGSPENRGVFKDWSDQTFIQGQYCGWVSCLEGAQNP